MAEIICRKIAVTEIVCEERVLSLKLFSFCQWESIPLRIINSGADLNQGMLSGEVGLSYGCGIIFKREHINWFEHGIWNIHTGKLPEYRGRHPMTWAFLNGDKSIFVTVHQIDEAIDRGTTIAIAQIPRGMDDGLTEMEGKLLDAMDQWLFELVLSNYETSAISTPNPAGQYQPALYKGIEIEDASAASAAYLFNAVRAQRSYGGAKIAGQLYVDAYYYDDRFKDQFAHGQLVVCQDGIRLVLFKTIQ